MDNIKANLFQILTNNNIKEIIESPFFIKDDCLKNIGNYSIKNVRLSFNNLVLKIDKNPDVFIPKYIISDKKITCLNIYFNSEVYFNIHFPFYQKIGIIKMEKRFNKFCYNIPWEFIFSKNIPNVAAGLNELKFTIISDSNCQADMIGIQYFLNESDRNCLVAERRDILVKFYNSLNNVKLTRGENTIQLCCQHFLNGIFLDNINIQEIDKITFYINDSVLFDYDKIMIHYFLQPINNTNNCFYLSLDNKPFQLLSINGAINFNKIDNVYFKITSKKEQTIQINYFEQNILRIECGLVGLFYLRNYNCKNYFNKLLTGDNYCPVTHEEIKSGELYMTCNSCKKNFQQKAISDWLKKYKKNCPYCRSPWENKLVYINSDS